MAGPVEVVAPALEAVLPLAEALVAAWVVAFAVRPSKDQPMRDLDSYPDRHHQYLLHRRQNH